ncbi:unnamed protein product [Prorocentrum cordatum]|uniref:Uncharacterized protein n=1 Tax=Prorocentrum cordatum TaxID=2364126 RepID=A0ABN9QCA5_9DINO|nr:unnamed protein product [Polarella glacialis]
MALPASRSSALTAPAAGSADERASTTPPAGPAGPSPWASAAAASLSEVADRCRPDGASAVAAAGSSARAAAERPCQAWRHCGQPEHSSTTAHAAFHSPAPGQRRWSQACAAANPLTSLSRSPCAPTFRSTRKAVNTKEAKADATARRAERRRMSLRDSVQHCSRDRSLLSSMPRG